MGLLPAKSSIEKFDFWRKHSKARKTRPRRGGLGSAAQIYRSLALRLLVSKTQIVNRFRRQAGMMRQFHGAMMGIIKEFKR